MSSLAAANEGLQKKVDAADADITEMKVGMCGSILSVYIEVTTTKLYVNLHETNATRITVHYQYRAGEFLLVYGSNHNFRLLYK